MFIYFYKREKESEWGRGREVRRDNIPSRLHPISAEPDAELEPTNYRMIDLSQNQELEA